MALIRPRPATPPRRPVARTAAHPRRLLVVLLFGALLLLMLQHLPADVPVQRFLPQAAVTGPRPPAPSTSAVPVQARAQPAGRKAPIAQPGAGTSGKFAYATGYGPVLGAAGVIRRFKIAVELPAGRAVTAGFAAEVDRALGDPRSWIGGRRFRFQRVPHAARAEFVVHLASAGTSQRMCREGGLETAGFTSCRLPQQVIINDNRWQRAVPGYGAPLAVYRAYAINHEVGHQLGYGHQPCPGKGRLAPVMMQQTYGLRGCRPNAWPYP